MMDVLKKTRSVLQAVALKTRRSILETIAFLPFVIGVIGYVKAGVSLSNALYSAFKLYGMYVLPDVDNIYIEVAKWTAPFVTAVTAASILTVLKDVGNVIKCRFSLFGKTDSVAVYSDDNREIMFKKGIGVIYPGEKFKKYAREHIIMFSSDQKNLQFYEEHKAELANRRVYIGVRELECSILKPFEDVSIFDINGAIARLLWKKIALWKRAEAEANVVIWGNNALAGSILSKGLQLNLFSCNQHVKYHVVTDNEYYRARVSDLKLMNKDEVHFYGTGESEIWKIIPKAEIVVVSDILNAEALETIAVKISGSTKIFYYSPKDGNIASQISYGDIIPFGRDENVYTDDNIRRHGLVKKAIALNEHYAELYGSERDWDLLSGLKKESNISASDFGEVLSEVEGRINEDEQAELEHIRWCRFMSLNHYKYGVPENGKNADEKKRIHKNLVSYSELSSEEKEKDFECISLTRNLHI